MNNKTFNINLNLNQDSKILILRKIKYILKSPQNRQKIIKE